MRAHHSVAAPRKSPSTTARAVGHSSDGKVPAAHGSVNNAVAQNEQVEGANPNGAQQIECASDPATMARMVVKDEMSLTSMDEVVNEHETTQAAEKKEKGGQIDHVYFGERIGTISAHKSTFNEEYVGGAKDDELSEERGRENEEMARCESEAQGRPRIHGGIPQNPWPSRKHWAVGSRLYGCKWKDWWKVFSM